MIKQTATTANGNGTAVPNRLAMNRLGPQKASASTFAKKTVDPIGNGNGLAQSHLTTKKLTEDKARARTLSRAQAVAERLSAATDQVASAITEATGAVYLSSLVELGLVLFLITIVVNALARLLVIATSRKGTAHAS